MAEGSPVRHLLAAAAGVAMVGAFAPFGLFPLAVLAPAVLLALWWRADRRSAFTLGLTFGLGLFGAGVSWVFVAIHVFGETGVLPAAVLSALFVLLLALFPATLGATLATLRARLHLPSAPFLLLLAPALWVVWEWLRSWLFSGFPWLAPGYSQIDAPLAGLAPLGGIWLTSWAVLASAGLLAWIAQPGTARLRLPLVAGALLLWFAAWGLKGIEWTREEGASLEVALIQGNIPQEVRWDPDWFERALRIYAEMTRAERGRDLVIWPENAIPIFFHQLRDFYDPLAAEVAAHGGELLIGAPVMEADGRYFNSMVALNGEPRWYHKRHLVPFGEFVPFERQLRGLIGFFDLPMSSFSRGDRDQSPILEVAGVPAAISICYEDLFGHAFRRGIADSTLLINASNNAWYGDSLAPHQHLQIARMRALETGRPLLRATTNGISALIDHDGRVAARSRQFEQESLRVTVQPRSGTTPYLITGDWPVLTALALLLGGLAYRYSFRK